jgi:hypothetical protein
VFIGLNFISLIKNLLCKKLFFTLNISPKIKNVFEKLGPDLGVKGGKKWLSIINFWPELLCFTRKRTMKEIVAYE